ncbi:MAG: hypothetical protein AAF401_07720 [Pseudomonadota bacterium]
MRYVVFLSREARAALSGDPTEALNPVGAIDGVAIVTGPKGHRLTIEASPDAADAIRRRFGESLIIEPVRMYRTSDDGLGP